ncbi:MAG: tetratricopeptide repeat protein [Ignavibacteria bacterium]|nr:tetratricopeptide repeat protein [Ignavibacteria bacterium]MBT8383241.1 tetratricopeptide repeat protein [Ignavibacteria bacterium]MBT8391733.1 tetratricopeptide repeat protein [Ignavibacteria bacterium]NNJ51593.1 tetratricopeptide repeat protein [Ignavibacteriaceae bacterium]NNL21316.1 tetratricopeptide repeat protein [Ignavibacteriaceae bacterium]
MKQLVSLVLLIFLVSCGSKKSADELLTEANTNLKEDKIPESVVLFEKFIDEYPNNEKAPEVINQLASVYQNKLIKNLSDTESLEKASSLFRKIYDDYPESNYAPTGLFMSGFVLANELNNYDKAKETYNLFLEKYPNHELAASAKEEVENMGLSPEEILRKNVAKEN